MAEFAYNNTKNTNNNYTPLKLNCRFHPRVSYKEDINSRSKSKIVDQLATELQTLMSVCKDNLQHAQKLQKCHYNKYAKPRSYTPGDKSW